MQTYIPCLHPEIHHDLEAYLRHEMQSRASYKEKKMVASENTFVGPWKLCCRMVIGGSASEPAGSRFKS